MDNDFENDERMESLGLTKADLAAYAATLEESQKAVTKYQDWCRQNPTPSIRTKFDFLMTLEGPLAAKLMYFSKVFIETGAWSRTQCFGAIFSLGIAALWELHKKNSAVSSFIETLRAIDPEVVARIESAKMLVGAKLHKQMLDEEFNQMASDFRDQTDLGGPV